MEEKERLLIVKLSEQNPELKKLWDEHLDYEKKIKDLERKLHLSPEEEIEKKRLQKLKLSGKDKMFEILSKYRVEGN
ncbi:MAG: DUF465 domain-containing protein [Deltaproteobacteria bacterium]|nr:DUF465 domain-containing protein [Deltaproteobacteria bacterium]MCL5278241.1 DUF465 domain-containing protein [Deltaproteobacteria bacterium]